MSITANVHNPQTVTFNLFDEGHNAGMDAWVAVKVNDGKGNDFNLFVKDREFLASLVSVAIKAHDALADAQDGGTNHIDQTRLLIPNSA